MPTDPIVPILAAVRTVLRGRTSVTLPEHGLDVLFDGGIVARCRSCRVCWEVKRSQFKLPGWWACPSGCRQGAVSLSTNCSA